MQRFIGSFRLSNLGATSDENKKKKRGRPRLADSIAATGTNNNNKSKASSLSTPRSSGPYVKCVMKSFQVPATSDIASSHAPTLDYPTYQVITNQQSVGGADGGGEDAAGAGVYLPRDKPPQVIDKSGVGWMCALCKRGPNAPVGTANGVTLGTLFGPYRIADTAVVNGEQSAATAAAFLIDDDSSSKQAIGKLRLFLLGDFATIVNLNECAYLRRIPVCGSVAARGLRRLVTSHLRGQQSHARHRPSTRLDPPHCS